MTKRNLILIGILGASYLLMVAYLTYLYPDQVDFMFQITFGFILVGTAFIGLKLSKGSSKKKGIFRAFKVLFASYAVAFASWMFFSVLLLPIIGYEGFMFLKSPLFIYILLGLTILVSPLIAKKLS